MRSRASSIYMKNSPFQSTSPNKPDPVAPVKKEKLSSEAMLDLFSEFGPMSYGQLKDAFSGDFGKLENIPDNCSNRSTERASVGPALSRTSSASSEYTSFEEELKENKFLRSMIIAPEQSVGYEIVDLLFPELRHESMLEKRDACKKLDVMTKKIEDEAQIGRFHFWLKQTEGKAANSLFNSYYKSSLVFFLVYNKNDEKSFDLMRNEAEKICQANNGQRFFVLIEANERVNGETKAANMEDVKNFKEAYEVNAAMTMMDLNSQSQTIRKQLLLLAKSSF